MYEHSLCARHFSKYPFSLPIFTASILKMRETENKAIQTVCYQVVGPGFKLALVWLWSPNIFYFLLHDSEMSSLGEYVDAGPQIVQEREEEDTTGECRNMSILDTF